ncbi:hypothetical protein BDR26DRAFT_909435 [Obelidium mucronatum]|nr:hypothetical protein BDR26DRAFT_909435 [Obelidium mucronatum]
MSESRKEFSVAVIGGGLVGSLAAVYFATRGWSVTVYELREDIRTVKQASGRSINLALSQRGISALEGAGTLIPMKGRMLHVGGGLTSQNYGYFGEAINSVDRKLVNQHLLNMAEKHKNVSLKFQYEVLSIDFEKKVINFKKPDGTVVKATADLIVGTDGAFSRVRRELMRVTRMNFMQEYIDHAYVELNMPPSATGEYQMDPSHLHIWPRQSFMMIALPNIDKSFTVTLFMPCVSHITTNQTALILGDAAHAMVPFYGQGMNCGFEDCLVFDEILTKHIGKRGTPSSERPTAEQIGKALDEYSSTRNPDAEAICDLALNNYIEMRSSVTKLSYKMRKNLEGFLHRIFPQSVIPLYTMVSFTRIPYSKALSTHRARSSWYDFIGRSLVLASNHTPNIIRNTDSILHFSMHIYQISTRL